MSRKNVDEDDNQLQVMEIGNPRTAFNLPPSSLLFSYYTCPSQLIHYNQPTYKNYKDLFIKSLSYLLYYKKKKKNPINKIKKTTTTHSENPYPK